MAAERKRERVQSLSDTSHSGITSHNGVIISSLSQSRGLPLSLAGIRDSVRVCACVYEGGLCIDRPHQEETHTHSLHTPSFKSMKEKKTKK